MARQPGNSAPTRTYVLDKPEVGFYRTKLCKGGPWVPVRIFLQHPTDPLTGEVLTERSPTLMAEKNGEPTDPHAVWAWCCDKPISADEYEVMRGFPVENPTKPIDLNKLPTIF
jgi:hypothetical protein